MTSNPRVFKCLLQASSICPGSNRCSNTSLNARTSNCSEVAKQCGNSPIRMGSPCLIARCATSWSGSIPIDAKPAFWARDTNQPYAAPTSHNVGLSTCTCEWISSRIVEALLKRSPCNAVWRCSSSRVAFRSLNEVAGNEEDQCAQFLQRQMSSSSQLSIALSQTTHCMAAFGIDEGPFNPCSPQ